MMTSGKTILVVEDERAVAKDLQKSLGGLGYRVPLTVASADEAIRAAGESCPDLVLMDIRIKGERDGIETALLLKTRFDVPVVYLTAYVDEQTVARARSSEPHGYLTKPVRPDELKSTIELALVKHEMVRRIRQRESWFETTLRSIADAVITTDQDGLITFMNPVAEQLTSWKSSDVRGKPLSHVLRLVDENTNEPVEDPLLRMLSNGKLVELNTALIGRSGEERIIADNATPILDESGQTLGTIVVFRDISEQRRLQRQLELAERLASLGTMAAGVAHEVNNPLAFVTGNIGFALERLRTARAQGTTDAALEELINALTDAQRGAERVSKIVADLKAFSRPSLDRPRRTDIRQVLGWSLEMAARELRGRASVELELSEVPPVIADETRLCQVFVNLLVNAAHAMVHEDPARNRIQIRTASLEQRVSIEIRDTGSGMAEEVSKRIFDPFFTTKAGGRGTGLGLSICRGIVKSLGGDIEVESTLGIGSLFRVLLPAAPSDGGTDEARPTTLAPPAPAVGRVLVVDDEQMIRATLERMLKPVHALTHAGSAQEALELIRSGTRFDLILCDLMMPEMNGMDLYREIESSYPEQARRMVFMTGGAFTSWGTEFLSSLSNPQLEKPFSPSQVRKLVQEQLEALGKSESCD